MTSLCKCSDFVQFNRRMCTESTCARLDHPHTRTHTHEMGTSCVWARNAIHTTALITPNRTRATPIGAIISTYKRHAGHTHRHCGIPDTDRHRVILIHDVQHLLASVIPGNTVFARFARTLEKCFGTGYGKAGFNQNPSLLVRGTGKAQN